MSIRYSEVATTAEDPLPFRVKQNYGHRCPVSHSRLFEILDESRLWRYEPRSSL